MASFVTLARESVSLWRDTRRIERRIAKATELFTQVHDQAVRAKQLFAYSRGKSAIPEPDAPTPLDENLIVSVGRYQLARRQIGVPLDEIGNIWTGEERSRDQVASVQQLARTLFSPSARRTYASALRRALECAAATEAALELSFSQDQLERLTTMFLEPSAEERTQHIFDYARNNASFVSAIEYLEFDGSSPSDPLTGARPFGQHGGLPELIALEVEQTQLHQGPLTAILRRYQGFGARYLIAQQRTLLGDDMGLGKTVQVLAAMCHLHHEGRRHFLVVAPNSVIVNWQRETHKHTRISPFVLHGPERETRAAHWSEHGGVAVTTYATLPKIAHLLRDPDMVALDEAHYVKNPGAQRTKAAESVIARCDHVVLMTGTALENRLDEMHHLVTLAQPAMCDTVTTVMSPASGIVSPDRVRTALAPVYLRRTQADVLRELPERIVVDEWVDLTDEDKAAYATCAGDVMSQRLTTIVGDGTRTSAKYERLTDLLEEHRAQKRKVVVYSYFRRVVDDVCALAGDAPRITGDTSSADRQRIIDAFSNDPDQQVLVSQIDAGGVGINLQAAQVVILMEAQFKPSTEWQAIARVHRMGQNKKVHVHRILAADTIEERLVNLIEEKVRLFHAFAHDSAMRDASEMAVDADIGVTVQDLKKLAVATSKFAVRTGLGL